MRALLSHKSGRWSRKLAHWLRSVAHIGTLDDETRQRIFHMAKNALGTPHIYSPRDGHLLMKYYWDTEKLMHSFASSVAEEYRVLDNGRAAGGPMSRRQALTGKHKAAYHVLHELDSFGPVTTWFIDVIGATELKKLNDGRYLAAEETVQNA